MNEKARKKIESKIAEEIIDKEEGKNDGTTQKSNKGA